MRCIDWDVCLQGHVGSTSTATESIQWRWYGCYWRGWWASCCVYSVLCIFLVVWMSPSILMQWMSVSACDVYHSCVYTPLIFPCSEWMVVHVLCGVHICVRYCCMSCSMVLCVVHWNECASVGGAGDETGAAERQPVQSFTAESAKTALMLNLASAYCMRNAFDQSAHCIAQVRALVSLALCVCVCVSLSLSLPRFQSYQ